MGKEKTGVNYITNWEKGIFLGFKLQKFRIRRGKKGNLKGVGGGVVDDRNAQYPASLSLTSFPFPVTFLPPINNSTLVLSNICSFS